MDTVIEEHYIQRKVIRGKNVRWLFYWNLKKDFMHVSISQKKKNNNDSTKKRRKKKEKQNPLYWMPTKQNLKLILGDDC